MIKKTIAACLMFVSIASADDIYFKDGKKIKANNVYEIGDYIQCQRFGGDVKYHKNMIAKIEKTNEIIKEEQYNPETGKPVNHQLLVKEYLKQNLFDPYSIMDLEIKEITKVRGQWACAVKYNAKNRSGGYVGLKHFIFMFDDNNHIDDIIEVK